MIDLKLLQAFDAKELELVLCGTVDINITDWRDNTEYRGGSFNILKMHSRVLRSNEI